MDLDKSSIERLKKRLYTREPKDAPYHERQSLPEAYPRPVADAWKPDAPQPRPRRDMSKVLRYILLGSVGFFLLSLLVSGFLIIRSSPISPAKVKIEIQGPAAMGGGEVLTLQILVKNENAAAIEDADLVIEFPNGTRSPDDSETELPRMRIPLGTLKAGDEIEQTTRAILLGEENSEQTVEMYVEYRIGGSSATFSSQKQLYSIVLTSAPLSVLVESLTEITAGQVLEFKVTIASNSDSDIKDVLLSVEYPFGFTFDAGSPKPAFRNSVWELGDLKPEEKKTIVVRGKMAGENEEERVFRFSAGTRSNRNETTLGTALMTALETITIKKPFIGVEVAVNGSASPQPTVSRGDRVRTDITWFNNLTTRVYDAEISVRISGAIVDRRSITAPDGFYQSANDTIIWSSETSPKFEELSEGDRGTVTFSFETADLSNETMFREPEIGFVVNIKGKRLSENNVPEVIESTVTRTIRVASDLSLASRAVYSSGPFDNSGPLPPQVGEETTYTVLWTVTNTSNTVSDIAVQATLPSYVRFSDRIEPSSADLTFNEVGGKLLWNVGSLASSARRDVAFQVLLKPSLSQRGTAPVLVGEQVLKGTDTFTRAEVGASRPALSTQLNTDPEFESGQDTVVE